jgi:hypothetical protein
VIKKIQDPYVTGEAPVVYFVGKCPLEDGSSSTCADIFMDRGDLRTHLMSDIHQLSLEDAKRVTNQVRGAVDGRKAKDKLVNTAVDEEEEADE